MVVSSISGLCPVPAGNPVLFRRYDCCGCGEGALAASHSAVATAPRGHRVSYSRPVPENSPKNQHVADESVDLSAMARELEPALSGLRELLAPLAQAVGRWATALAPLAQAVGRGLARLDTAENLLEQGWVPNHTTPFDLVAECGDDSARLQTSLLYYYTDNWVEVRTQLESQTPSYGIDDEAKATFREALDNHEAGRYRSVSRVLFPEFDRVFRAELFDGRTGQISFNNFVDELTGENANLGLGDFLISGIQDMVLFDYLTKGGKSAAPGLAVDVRNETDLERAKRSPIPTRHAVVHGLVAYSSPQSSLNAIFIADYVFSVLSVAQRRRQEKRDSRSST